MRALLGLILSLALVEMARAQTETDAAHRADALRTQQLNRRAAASVAARDAGAGTDDDAYRAARARYEKAMAEWRRRVDSCNRGDWSACDH